MIFEEKGGNPTKITFARRKTSGLCSVIAEDHPMIHKESVTGTENNRTTPTFSLKCPKDTHISTVKFASFGNPTGKCGSYTKGDCHDPSSTSVVEEVRIALIIL